MCLLVVFAYNMECEDFLRCQNVFAEFTYFLVQIHIHYRISIFTDTKHFHFVLRTKYYIPNWEKRYTSLSLAPIKESVRDTQVNYTDMIL